MFIDKARILIKAGDGGDGCTSFYTEKFVPNGGPDGGNGGKGGDVIFEATKHKNTLLDFKYAKRYRAEDGDKGKPRFSAGKGGKDLIIKVPVGTVIRDEETGDIIHDMFSDGEQFVILEGGRGGKGNAVFKSSRRQAPHFSQLGEKLPEHSVTLELMTIADVGLIGYPNVGKSTILSVISSAKPKIGSYHFTTLSPNLGMVSANDEVFVVADIPGLIEGASEGAGLGHDFLRHIARTRVLVHVVDAGGSEDRDPLDDFNQINSELASYDEKLLKKPQILVLNKADLISGSEKETVERFRAITDCRIVLMSAIIHSGADELVAAIYHELKKLPPIEPLEYQPFRYAKPSKEGFEVIAYDDGTFELVGGFIDELARNVVFESYDSMQYFQKQLKDSGINKALIAKGAKNGDTVIMLDTEFEFFI